MQNLPKAKVVRDPKLLPKVAAIRQRIWLLSLSKAAVKAASLENGKIVEAKKDAQNKVSIIIEIENYFFCRGEGELASRIKIENFPQNKRMENFLLKSNTYKFL